MLETFQRVFHMLLFAIFELMTYIYNLYFIVDSVESGSLWFRKHEVNRCLNWREVGFSVIYKISIYGFIIQFEIQEGHIIAPLNHLLMLETRPNVNTCEAVWLHALYLLKSQSARKKVFCLYFYVRRIIRNSSSWSIKVLVCFYAIRASCRHTYFFKISGCYYV